MRARFALPRRFASAGPGVVQVGGRQPGADQGRRQARDPRAAQPRSDAVDVGGLVPADHHQRAGERLRRLPVRGPQPDGNAQRHRPALRYVDQTGLNRVTRRCTEELVAGFATLFQ